MWDSVIMRGELWQVGVNWTGKNAQDQVGIGSGTCGSDRAYINKQKLDVRNEFGVLWVFYGPDQPKN